MIKTLILKSINLYQKWISPRKGFSCAHRVATGEVGCSGYAKQVIARFGVLKGLLLLNRRFKDCAWHSARLRADLAATASQTALYRSGLARKQTGSVDCSGIDCSGADCKSAECVPDGKHDFCGCIFDATDLLSTTKAENAEKRTSSLKNRNSLNEAKYLRQKKLRKSKQ